MVQTLFDRLLRPGRQGERFAEPTSRTFWSRTVSTASSMSASRDAMRAGRVGLAQNRLPRNTTIRDVQPGGCHRHHRREYRPTCRQVGQEALAAGGGGRGDAGGGGREPMDAGRRRRRRRCIRSVSLAAGTAPSSKPIWPRADAPASSAASHRRTSSPPATSHTSPSTEFLATQNHYRYAGPLRLSPGHAVGLRMVPMVQDLRFAWEETAQKLLDEQAQKVRDSLHAALIGWAREAGEGSDYTDNLPAQCLHPVGHWYEIPNLLRNGVLAGLLAERPGLRYLMLHNIDTLGADLDPGLLGLHIQSGAGLSFEVISRRIEDRGGGLARVDGRVRLVEGLAMPREEDEFQLSYYNSMTTWIDIDRLLAVFNLSRADLADPEVVATRVRELACTHAHLHHAEGREKTLGPRPGRCFPGRAMGKTLERHDRAS